MSQPDHFPLRSTEYVHPASLESEPIGAFVPPERRHQALLDALRGVDLGAYDHRIVNWTTRTLDDSTLRVLVSWLERTRSAGVHAALTVAKHNARRRPSGGYLEANQNGETR